MLNKLKKMQAEKSSEKGFTIIEVMIVLAIAGLIILIVFLAVPALQRNSRNTQRKSDVGRIAAAATTVIQNKNGAISALTSAAVQAEVGTLGYYTSASVTVTSGLSVTAVSVDAVQIRTGAKCDPSANGDTVVGSQRQFAIMYTAEPATRLCVDS
ncbi:MAG: prepilin-type N-terminal cleavage/methylation domain-containing protein [Candidatus Saccharimonadales bacterium]